MKVARSKQNQPCAKAGCVEARRTPEAGRAGFGDGGGELLAVSEETAVAQEIDGRDCPEGVAARTSVDAAHRRHAATDDFGHGGEVSLGGHAVAGHPEAGAVLRVRGKVWAARDDRE